VVGLTLVAAGLFSLNISPLSLARAEDLSVTVLDRNQRLLRAYTASDGRWRLPVEPAEVDRRYLAMLIAFEDRRFRAHWGVDPRAVGRAIWQLARHGRIVSGASTLTMQVARLLIGEHQKSAVGKLRQAWRALELERRLGKDDILRLYLRLAPFGGNLEGVRAAALAYFGKEPRRLSLAEAALLVALPQSPALRRPDRFPAAARQARNRVLAQALALRIIAPEDAGRAMAEPVPTGRREFPLLAPHLADAEVAANPTRLVHRLTVDATAQADLERLVHEHVEAQAGRLSAALIAVDHASGEVLAEVGSPGYLDVEHFGAVDMVSAIRSPGSTLKPLIYGLAFEAGLAHPETLIEDRPVRFGLYAPKNFDQDWHGWVTIRAALAQSLNIPAVKVLEQLGPAKLFGRLQQIGAEPSLPAGAEPSLAIALGGVGLRLADLATLYTALARGGEPVRLRHRREGTGEASSPLPALLSPLATFYVTDILRHAPAPAHARSGQIAYKTGTSYGFRDAWAIGYDGRHTVAVWVGRPDGAATPGLAGRTAAAPLLFDAFARLAPQRTPLPPAPPGVLRAAGGALPPPLRRFGGSAEKAADGYLDPPVQIAFPPDRAELAVDEADNTIALKAEGGALPLVWLLDGQPIGSDAGRREAEVAVRGRGFYTVSVVDAKGRGDRVTIRIK